MTSRQSNRGRLPVATLVVLGCVVAALLTVPGGAVAGDGTSLIYFEEDEHDVESGETITLDVVAYDDGDSMGNGIDALVFDLEYDADVMTAVEVEHGPMLADGNDSVEITGAGEIDEENGTVTIEQEREPPGDGTTGNDIVATITLEVSQDAGQTSSTIDVTNARTNRVESDYPAYPPMRQATIHVDGGAEDELDDDADGTPAGVTFADDLEDDDESGAEETNDGGGDDSADSSTDDGSGDEAASGDGGAASSDDAGSDAVPGFAVLGSIAGIVGAFAVWLRGRRP